MCGFHPYVRGVLAACAIGVGACAAQTDGAAKSPVYAAVASNFAGPFQDLAQAFEKSTGHVVKTSSGSTGKLYTQIENGGPFDVFLSADAAHVDLLERDGLAEKGSRFTYAVGRIALYAPRLTPVDASTLTNVPIAHLAIANPDAAPYGAAAMDTLRGLGLADTFRDRLVFGENIAQALQFVDSGAAEAGFVAYAQVTTMDAKTYWLVPEDRHAPIRQDACLLRAGRDNAAARALLDFLKTDEAARTIESFGYAVERAKASAK